MPPNKHTRRGDYFCEGGKGRKPRCCKYLLLKLYKIKVLLVVLTLTHWRRRRRKRRTREKKRKKRRRRRKKKQKKLQANEENLLSLTKKRMRLDGNV